jgi:hypothetical protein
MPPPPPPKKQHGRNPPHSPEDPTLAALQRAAKKHVDIYKRHQVYVARAWPRKPAKSKKPLQQANRKIFGEIASGLPRIDGTEWDVLLEMASAAPEKRRDAAMRAAYGSLIQYGHISQTDAQPNLVTHFEGFKCTARLMFDTSLLIPAAAAMFWTLIKPTEARVHKEFLGMMKPCGLLWLATEVEEADPTLISEVGRSLFLLPEFAEGTLIFLWLGGAFADLTQRFTSGLHIVERCVMNANHGTAINRVTEFQPFTVGTGYVAINALENVQDPGGWTVVPGGNIRAPIDGDYDWKAGISFAPFRPHVDSVQVTARVTRSFGGVVVSELGTTRVLSESASEDLVGSGVTFLHAGESLFIEAHQLLPGNIANPAGGLFAMGNA